jgi:hypothetical protein
LNRKSAANNVMVPGSGDYSITMCSRGSNFLSKLKRLMIGCGPGGGRFGKWWTSLSRTEVEFKDMYFSKGEPVHFPRRSCRAPCCCKSFTLSTTPDLLMEQLDYNLLFFWFVGLSMDERVRD